MAQEIELDGEIIRCICDEGIHNQGEFDCACECHKILEGKLKE